MKKYLRTFICFSIIALLIQLVPVQAYADISESPVEKEHTEVFLYSTQPDEFIDLFKEENAEEILISIADGSSVQLIASEEEYSLVSYTQMPVEGDSSTEEVIWTGYVQSFHVINVSDLDDFLEKREDEDFTLENYNKDIVVEKELPILPDASVKESTELVGEGEAQDTSITAETETILDESKEQTISDVKPIQNQQLRLKALAPDADIIGDVLEEPEVEIKLASVPAPPVINYRGVALKNTTNVYSQTSSNSSVLKSYRSGAILQYRSYDSTWYEATVFLSGKAHTGYIHSNDVDTSVLSQSTLKGIGLKSPTRVYSTASTSSKVLKSYKQGHLLQYRTFTSDWYEATVFVNGKAHTGYISANDVEVPVKSQTALRGIGLKNSTNVYSSASTSSKVLKSYKQGRILQYRTFTNGWYEATVIINRKAQTGYIHVNDVENILTSKTALRGIGLKSPTRVYSSASTSSKVLKSYKQGHILQYRTFSSSWYEATVIINGKAQTGYIHANDVETATTQQSTINGFGDKSPTNVYASATKTSRVLKSYRKSQKMIYRTFSTNWYEATVILNGKAHTGYIHKNDVTTIPGKIVVLDPGHGGSDPGARASGIVEKELNLDIALRTKKLLESAGITVIMTRSTDVFLPLADRARIANTSNADIFVSIHGNAFNGLASGVETFWYGKYERANSILLANILQDNVVKSTGIRHRRVAEGNFHVIRETEIPSALVEVGFIDNPSDAAKLKQSKYRQLAAEGILNGVLEYFK